MAVEIGELLVKFQADQSDLERKVNQLERQLTRAESRANTASVNISGSMFRMAASFLTVSAAVSQFTNAMSDISSLDRLSQATGISIERIDSLRTAMQATGVETQTFTQVLSQFGTRMQEAISNPASRTAIALRELQINFRNADGSVRNFDDVMGQAADAFARYADGANKTALAAALFGEEGGPRLVRFLNQGSNEIERQRAELEAHGRVMTQDGVQRAREYEAAMNQLSSAVRELTREIALGFGPAVAASAQAIASFIRNLREGAALEDFSRQMGELRRQHAELTTALQGNSVIDMLMRSSRETDLARITREMELLQAQADRLTTTLRGTIVPENHDPNSPTAPPQAPSINTEEIKKLQAELEATTARLAGQKQSLLFSALYGSSDPTTITTEFEAAMAQIDHAVQRGALTAAEAARQKRGLAQQEQGYILDTATLAASTITAVFSKNKAAAIGAAVINTAVGITRAMQLPWPFNWAQAALVAATGAAQISAISSASESGGGAGVPSVNGGGADAGSGAAQQGGVTNTLAVQGIEAGQIFTGDVVRELIERIAQATRDGHKVVLLGR